MPICLPAEGEEDEAKLWQQTALVPLEAAAASQSPSQTQTQCRYALVQPPQSIGAVRSFYGNFLVAIRALTYIETLGAEGIRQAAEAATINANYLASALRKMGYSIVGDGYCMHEFVISLADIKKNYGVTALDMAKALQDRGMHPPTMYFPLIVPEALMVEPTETESPEMLDRVLTHFEELLALAKSEPDSLHQTPRTTLIGRPDEVLAAREPILCYTEDLEAGCQPDLPPLSDAQNPPPSAQHCCL